MAIVKTLNILKLFGMDALIAADSGISLRKYMMQKHGWDEITYGNMRSSYLMALSMLNKVEEIKEIPDFDETANMPVPGRVAEIKEGYLYEVLYKWGNGHQRGFGRIAPRKFDFGSPNETMYILCKGGGVMYQHVEDIEIVREICNLDG